MKNFYATARNLLLALSTLPALWAAPALAISEDQAFVLDVRETSIPIGHAQFCQSRPDECGQNANMVTYQNLSQSKWDELLQVNAHWNDAIRPINDIDLYQTEEFWTYPREYGDCEDYVLAKRRSLIERGWAPSTLLITVVKQANGEGHAVLTVRTDRGDLILDNQEGLIKVWSQTNYTYIKRQSQQHQGRWMELADNREVILASR